jgi:hypothetical protein
MDTHVFTSADAAQATSSGHFYTGAPYQNEYMAIFRFRSSDDTAKITCIKEFVDSASTSRFFAGHSRKQQLASAPVALNRPESHCSHDHIAGSLKCLL